MRGTDTTDYEGRIYSTSHCHCLMAFGMNQHDWRQVPHHLTNMNQKTKFNEIEKFAIHLRLLCHLSNMMHLISNTKLKYKTTMFHSHY